MIIVWIGEKAHKPGYNNLCDMVMVVNDNHIFTENELNTFDFLSVKGDSDDFMRAIPKVKPKMVKDKESEDTEILYSIDSTEDLYRLDPATPPAHEWNIAEFIDLLNASEKVVFELKDMDKVINNMIALLKKE